MPEKFQILGQTVGLGKSVTVNLDIARLHTRTKVNVPIIIERAKTDGPVLLLLAGIHGDEVNGVEIVRQIIAKGFNKPQKGTVICIPVLNVFGFLIQTRQFPDGRDLNRVFPGSKKGSLAARFAYQVMTEIVPKIDYCIDYHTGAARRFNYTHLRVDDEDKDTLAIARAFGSPFILHAKKREKSFRESTTKAGKKILLFEGGKSLYLDKKVTQVGIEGALRVMQHLGMRQFNEDEFKFSEYTPPIMLKTSSWVRARHSGMYRSLVSVGKKVEKNEKIGSISDPFGDFESIVKAPKNGYIINSNHLPIVNQGDALFNIGYE